MVRRAAARVAVATTPPIACKHGPSRNQRCYSELPLTKSEKRNSLCAFARPIIVLVYHTASTIADRQALKTVAACSQVVGQTSNKSVVPVTTQRDQLRLGTQVTVLSGTYAGCNGEVKLFSSTTDKPKVCRDCRGKASSGKACCGATTRSRCWFYALTQLRVRPATAAPLTTPEDVKHVSFFRFDTLLKCSGFATVWQYCFGLQPPLRR